MTVQVAVTMYDYKEIYVYATSFLVNKRFIYKNIFRRHELVKFYQIYIC